MLKSKVIGPRAPSAWAEHNARVAKMEATHRELERIFPHKFRHSKIGRLWMVGRDWRREVQPAIIGYRSREEPPIRWQVLLGILIVVTFLAACYAL